MTMLLGINCPIIRYELFPLLSKESCNLAGRMSLARAYAAEHCATLTWSAQAWVRFAHCLELSGMEE